jgi:hypothetical protein
MGKGKVEIMGKGKVEIMGKGKDGKTEKGESMKCGDIESGHVEEAIIPPPLLNL